MISAVISAVQLESVAALLPRDPVGPVVVEGLWTLDGRTVEDFLPVGEQGSFDSIHTIKVLAAVGEELGSLDGRIGWINQR